MDAVLFSRKSDDWGSPQKLFNELNAEFGGFDLDVAASAENAKCVRYYDKASNGLGQDWALKNWCNPPYSQLGKWILKARREQLRGNLTVMLIPARTDTKAFHESIYQKDNVEIRFLKGRLYFGDGKGRAPFPSMIVIFRPFQL